MKRHLVIELDEWEVACLAVLDRVSLAGTPEVELARRVVQTLAAHAVQGIYRPCAWERPWLTQVFGHEFLERLEPGDPGGKPGLEDIFTRPKKP